MFEYASLPSEPNFVHTRSAGQPGGRHEPGPVCTIEYDHGPEALPCSFGVADARTRSASSAPPCGVSGALRSALAAASIAEHETRREDA